MNKKVLIALNIISIISLTLLFAESVFAWFYFPSSKNLIINTAPNLDIDIELYHLELNAETEVYQFIEVDTLNNETNEFSMDTDLVFFHWGGEYICESNKEEYYAIIATYDSSSFSSQGNIKLMINSIIDSQSEFYYENEDEENINLRFPIVDVSYSIASTNQVNITSSAASMEAKSAEYTDINMTGTDDQSEPVYTVSGTEEKHLRTLNSTQYIETYTNEEGQIDSRIKIVIYIKVTAAEERVNEIMEDLSTSFGSALAVIISNKLTISTNLRSVPMHDYE